MGRRSPQAAKEKRRKQKLLKRHQKRSSIGSSPEHGSRLDEPGREEHTTEDFCDALDEINEANLDQWEKHKQALEMYNDVHPAIVTDSKSEVEVYVKGARKEMHGVDRVSIEHYFTSIHDKEKKSQQLHKILRDRIEELETALEAAKYELHSANYDAKTGIQRVRYFWRNRLLEGCSRGGQMLKAATRK